MDFANYIGRNFFRFKNPKVVAPPGELIKGDASLVVVASVMRSGTHVMIDSILNNFEPYRRKPLYVDVDRLLDTADPQAQMDELIEKGGYVVKTHFPQAFDNPGRDRLMRKLALASRVVLVTRDIEATYKSSQSWHVELLQDVATDKENYLASVQNFFEFWSQFSCMRVTFDELLDKEAYLKLIRDTGKHIGCTPAAKITHPPLITQKRQVYMAKALTRLLGNHAPVINTTIRFGKPKS